VASKHIRLLPGTIVLNKWTIDARIARGGVATVYEATHRNGLKVALKVLHPEHIGSFEVTSRFAREGRIANGIEHPGIVRVLDDDVTADGRPFLVMELLRGELLEERRVKHGGQLPFAKAIAVGIDILDVLAVAHAKQIIHRDIKPENIFITQDNVLKVLDFGIARIKQTLGTATGLLLGTADFMAPEQALGISKEIDERTDVWGVGATLFALLSGQFVHQGTSIAEVIRNVSGNQARSLADAMPGAPAKLVETVDRALRFQKRERWQSAREMQDALADSLRLLAKERLGATFPDAVIQTRTQADVDELVTVRKPKGEVAALRQALKTLNLETDVVTVKERMPSALWRDLGDDETEHTIREEHPPVRWPATSEQSPDEEDEPVVEAFSNRVTRSAAPARLALAATALLVLLAVLAYSHC
jgi:serine/threonine protein kinase